MDMYQKRKMRQEKKMNEGNQKNDFDKIVLNWVNPTLVNSDTNPLFIWKSRNFLFTN